MCKPIVYMCHELAYTHDWAAKAAHRREAVRSAKHIDQSWLGESGQGDKWLYVLMSVDFDGMTVEEVAVLPDNPARFGDQWLEEQRTPVLRAPSVIIPEADPPMNKVVAQSPRLSLSRFHPLDQRTAGVIPFSR